MKIALSGSSGFVGSALKKAFPDHVCISRHDREVDILKKLEGVDIVINLAGAPILKRWSEAYKKVLLASRIDTTRKLVDALNKSDVKHFISTSAIGIYPDGEVCDERCSEMADDFLGELTQLWESEAKRSLKPTTILRFGVVLGADGGALQTMLTPFKVGLGGVIGNGRMMTSWIDIEDLVNMYRFIIERRLEGVFNAVSPNPITNHAYTKALGKVLHRPTVFTIPEFVLKIIYGEGASVLTGSKEIHPKMIEEHGFRFEYTDIDSSLRHLLT